jgi:hypothetical protein
VRFPSSPLVATLKVTVVEPAGTNAVIAENADDEPPVFEA